MPLLRDVSVCVYKDCVCVPENGVATQLHSCLKPLLWPVSVCVYKDCVYVPGNGVATQLLEAVVIARKCMCISGLCARTRE